MLFEARAAQPTTPAAARAKVASLHGATTGHAVGAISDSPARGYAGRRHSAGAAAAYLPPLPLLVSVIAAPEEALTTRFG